MRNRKALTFVLAAMIAVVVAVAIYTFLPRNSFDGSLAERLVVDDMTHSKAYGWIFAKHENYNGEFVLYIEGLHRVVYAKPSQEAITTEGKADIVIKMGKELRIYGNLLIYGGKQYAIVEHSAYTLPPWVSKALSSGEVTAFTSLGRELAGVEYVAFPILDAITQYRVSPLTISPYPNYFIDVTECRVYDNIVEYLVGSGASVVFDVNTMEFAYSTDPEIEQAYIDSESDPAEDDDV